MTDNVLVGTNPLVYAYNRSEPEKQGRALEVLDRLASGGNLGSPPVGGIMELGNRQEEVTVRMGLDTIRLYLEPNPGGIYTVTSPHVPGLVTEGGTPAELTSNVQEALDALVEAWRVLGKDLPAALRPVLTDRPQTVEALVSA